MTKKILKVILGEEVYLSVELDLVNGVIPPSPIPPPTPPPSPPSPSDPGNGTKSNPYKLNTQDTRGLGLTSALWPDCAVNIPNNTKVYFELDPGLSQNLIVCMMNVKGFNNQYLNFYHLIINKVTGEELQPETQIGQSYALGVNLWNRPLYAFDKVKYIFAVENVGPQAMVEVFMSW